MGMTQGTTFSLHQAGKAVIIADNKQLKGQQDRNRGNSQEPYEVEDLYQKYPHLSHKEVAEAVENMGRKGRI